MNERPRRLLILGCTRAKRHDPAVLPAVERYDGPAFRVVRRYLATQPVDPPDIFVLSAQHGLIAGDVPIEDYNKHLVASQACALQPVIQAELVRLIESQRYRAIFVHAGPAYQRLLRWETDASNTQPTVMVASGPPGKKLATLHDWLHGRPPTSEFPTTPRCQPPRIRGVFVSQTPDQVRENARRALANGANGHEHFTSWCVSIEGVQVAPKWLVAQLTGLAPGAFRTSEARRVLSQLGIEVRRA